MQIVVAHNPQLKIDIKDIRKVRRLGGKSGQCRHNSKRLTGNEILQNEVTGTQTSLSTNFGGKLSFIASFLFPVRSTAATYICTAPTCTTTIITLEPCALNAEFQHFILRLTRMRNSSRSDVLHHLGSFFPLNLLSIFSPQIFRFLHNAYKTQNCRS
jgi:hypothetical protein